MSYQVNLASRHTHDRHVGFSFAHGKHNKMFLFYLFSAYRITKLQLNDKNISTHSVKVSNPFMMK